eukprot:SAG11_NODE_33131_length_279_cov_0.572222_1_plen_61_part_01
MCVDLSTFSYGFSTARLLLVVSSAEIGAGSSSRSGGGGLEGQRSVTNAGEGSNVGSIDGVP